MHPEEEKDAVSEKDYQVEHDWRIAAIERKFHQLDEILEKLTYVLYGVALGLIISMIIEA